MDPSPSQPTLPEKQGSVLTASQWLTRRVLAPQDTSVNSLGEFLLPTLLGAMEACWVDAVLIGLASAALLGSSVPLLPLWAPFVFIIGSQWLLHYVDRRDGSARSQEAEEDNGRGDPGGRPGTTAHGRGDPGGRPGNEEGHVKNSIPGASLLFVIMGAFCLYIIWLQVYAQTMPIFDLRWLSTLVSDILFFNTHFYQALFITGLSAYLCWRGLRLSSRVVEPSDVFRVLCIGLGVILAVILLRASLESYKASFADDVNLLLLIPIFLFLSLAAHALARITFVRHTHPTGLQGSIVAQERAVITIIASLGLVLLLVTVAVGLFASPAFLASVEQGLSFVGIIYGWLTGALAWVMVLIVTPIFWLISFIHPSEHPQTIRNLAPPPTKTKPQIPPAVMFVQSIFPYVSALLAVLFILLMILIIRRLLRRRKRTSIAKNLQKEDIHESLWSWSLFWGQVKSLLRAFFGRFFPRRVVKEETIVIPAEIRGDPAARNIREIYRAFLKKATARGYARKKDETPNELRQRLDEKAPIVEPQLEVITEAYARVRYGAILPDAGDVASIQGTWSELDQKWV